MTSGSHLALGARLCLGALLLLALGASCVPGLGPAPPPTATPGPTATPAPPTPTPGPPTATPSPSLVPTQTPALLPAGTRAFVEEFFSPAMGRRMPYAIVLPPGYESNDRRYPVLYLLHGLYGGYGEWLDVGIAIIFDLLVREGDIEPFIVVLPEGDASAWINWPDGGPRWADHFVHDLVQHVDRTYRTIPDRERRALGGLSMGGEGALQTSLRNPDVFGVVGAHSPTMRLTYDNVPVEAYGDEERWRRHQSLWLIQNSDTARRLKIWIDMGDGDPYIFSAEALHEALRAKGVPHAYWTPVGTHEAEYWILHQEAYLRWYSAVFSLPLGSPEVPPGPAGASDTDAPPPEPELPTEGGQ